ncbi:heme ABC transporter ATP-binding protein [Candidatus Izimaplasma bacterium ZiA1]|uniref:ABC transporter ATP-binding protein n=1 Tax=Candidatus Izimoplasma sp. ZiA1 TaxID=2024899 RepID=UPI000BAA3F93|nr:heme ABC transporter ATP-binding protein [Candidatus Izimaplasma bacterium ZiA1]
MEYIVEMLNITKEFPGIKANDNVTLQLKKGEIHALLGENGAGKSTLMSVLFGLYTPEEGTIKVRGEEVVITNPNDANVHGIGMVHQHFKLVHNFTVAENIVLGYEDTKFGFLKFDDAVKKINDLSDKYKLKVDTSSLISDISVGMQQRVEILKMLYRDAEILIFDEPTAVLTPQEIEELMGIMKDLTKEGKSIILITHKLNEIKQVADRCSVLRKGKYIGTVEVENTSVEKMAEMMVGREVNFVVDKEDAKPKDTVLEVKNLTVRNHRLLKDVVKDISFEAKRGEILCIAGIEGNGQTQLVEAITGLTHVTSGNILLKGNDITKFSVREKNNAGVSHIPEDRHKHGLVLDYSLEENLILQSYFEEKFQERGFLRFDEIRQHAKKLIANFDIRSGKGPTTSARSMSGGNQQKAIVAREIDRDTDLLIAVQPTRGLDVGAIEYIHKQLIAQRDAGKAVLLISLELDEVLNVSDRIIVMYEGEAVGEFDPKKTNENELGLYMAGSKRSEA